MKKDINQRQIALKILDEFFDNPRDLKGLIENHTKKLNSQASGFVNTLVYGSVRYSITLDYYIRKLSSTRFSKLDKTLVNILRLSLYQIIYMDHIPNEVAVYEGVNLAKTLKNQRLKSFTNGILRNFLRKEESIRDVSKLHYMDYLRVKYSYPDWIIKKLIQIYPDHIEQVLEAYNKEPNFDIRANSLKTSKEELIARLEEDNYNIQELEGLSHGLRISKPKDIFKSEEFKDGKFYVQSFSSQKVVDILDISKSDKILDLCAAPGGKTSHLYEKSNGQGHIVACDIADEKLKLIHENFTRLGHGHIDMVKLDARIYNEDFESTFDLVLVDAPCSSLGLIRKYPEMKHTKTEDQVASLANIQKEILQMAKEYVKTGGYLVYSTCSFTQEENEANISDFLSKNKNYKLEQEIIRLSPHTEDSDGFTIGVLRRND